MDTEKLLALVELWGQTYNEDVSRMVQECYAPNCRVYPMGRRVLEGRDWLQRAEEAVLRHAPRRRLRIERTHPCGNVVCVEAVLLDPDQGEDWSLPFVAVLTVDADGRIAIDRTYTDWSRWPGV